MVIVLAINTALSTLKVSSHVRLQPLTYNKNGNLSGLLGITATSIILLLTLRAVILTAARGIDSAMIDITEDQKWYRLRVYTIGPERYDNQSQSMELIIEAETRNVNFV